MTNDVKAKVYHASKDSLEYSVRSNLLIDKHLFL